MEKFSSQQSKIEKFLKFSTFYNYQNVTDRCGEILFRVVLLLIMFCHFTVRNVNANAVKINVNYSVPTQPETTLNVAADLNTIVDSAPRKGWMCHCWNSTQELDTELECRCEGQALVRIPQKLHKGMQRLTIATAGLTVLRSNGLKIYSSSLRDIMLTDLDYFETIQDGAFQSIFLLRSIYISHAPKLTHLSKDVFLGISPTLKTIRIIYSGLFKIPDMSHLSTGIILQMVDLEGNRIGEIESHTVRLKTEQLILDNNQIVSVADSAFFGSEIGKLSFKGNHDLEKLHKLAFLGIANIQDLDLSSTKLVEIPTSGLESLEILRIQNTHTLKTIPSIYNFKNLQKAWLTHSFHCCAFKFPSRHDPERHAERLKYLQKACSKYGVTQEKIEVSSYSVSNDFTETMIYGKRKRHAPDHNFYTEPEPSTDIIQSQIGDLNYDLGGNITDYSKEMVTYIQSITGAPIVIVSADPNDNFHSNVDFGEFHNSTAQIPQSTLNAVCGNLTQKISDVKCYPMPDALNPCEDVMGSHWLRASVWVVVLLAVFGNVAVLVVLLSNWSDGSVPKFLMSHLAFADLCMGLYLLFIASIDAHSMGEYFNYAFDWQYGAGCQLAGFLTVFASHLSVFTLTIITLERWFAITHAIYLNKRIKLKPAVYIMIGGWIYSCVMSSFPLFGISNYSSTSICLPMEARDPWDVAYLVAVLGINGIAFCIIAICYAQIYFSLGKETRRAARNATTGEMTIAKKMALLVFTNFSCWAPIAFFGLTALAGYPLINVTKSKILLVFFYPLNSCADPYLYAILTSQYRRDLYMLLARFGLCTKKAQQYKNSYSFPVTNHTYPVPLMTGNSQSPTTPKPKEERCILNEDFV